MELFKINPDTYGNLLDTVNGLIANGTLLLYTKPYKPHTLQRGMYVQCESAEQMAELAGFAKQHDVPLGPIPSPKKQVT